MEGAGCEQMNRSLFAIDVVEMSHLTLVGIRKRFCPKDVRNVVS
jgi:hypothetical protein